MRSGDGYSVVLGVFAADRYAVGNKILDVFMVENCIDAVIHLLANGI